MTKRGAVAFSAFCRPELHRHNAHAATDDDHFHFLWGGLDAGSRHGERQMLRVHAREPPDIAHGSGLGSNMSKEQETLKASRQNERRRGGSRSLQP